MLSGASADFYKAAPWMILFPGLVITLAVFAFNLSATACATGSTRR
jgi:peptide/nickel transport system permease protein